MMKVDTLKILLIKKCLNKPFMLKILYKLQLKTLSRIFTREIYTKFKENFNSINI